MILLILLGGLLVGGVLVALWFYRQSLREARSEELWREFAAAYPGLEYREGDHGPELLGTYAGVPIRVYLAQQGDPNAPIAVTRFVAQCRATFPSAFDLSRPSSLRRVTASAELEEVAIGDRAIDQMFVVRGEDPEAIRALLAGPELRAALVTHATEHCDLRVLSDGSVSMRKAGRISDPPSLEEALAAVTGLTAAFEANQKTT